MDYYGPKEVMELTGCKQSYAYDLIRKLQKMFERDYPDAITVRAKIPKWYFNKKMKNKENEEE